MKAASPSSAKTGKVCCPGAANGCEGRACWATAARSASVSCSPPRSMTTIAGVYSAVAELLLEPRGLGRLGVVRQVGGGVVGLLGRRPRRPAGRPRRGSRSRRRASSAAADEVRASEFFQRSNISTMERVGYRPCPMRPSPTEPGRTAAARPRAMRAAAGRYAHRVRPVRRGRGPGERDAPHRPQRPRPGDGLGRRRRARHPGRLSAALALSAPATSAMLDRLERQGHVHPLAPPATTAARWSSRSPTTPCEVGSRMFGRAGRDIWRRCSPAAPTRSWP